MMPLSGGLTSPYTDRLNFCMLFLSLSILIPCSTHTCTHTNTYTHTNTHTHKYAHTRIHTHTHTHTGQKEVHALCYPHKETPVYEVTICVLGYKEAGSLFPSCSGICWHPSLGVSMTVLPFCCRHLSHCLARLTCLVCSRNDDEGVAWS